MDSPDMERTDGNSLLKAVYLSRLRLTRLLLEGGAYINESNEHGETPLMVACRTKHCDAQSVPRIKMVRYLLENGADPNIQDKSGKTALIHACLHQTGSDILSLLLSSGADPTLEDHSGLSALIYAVNSGSRDVLSVLLDACRAKGKEVIIITTNQLPSGHHMTRQYLNVPPPTDLDERLLFSPPYDARSPPQGSSAAASPQSGSPLLALRDLLVSGSGPVSSRPGSPVQHPSPLCLPSEKRLHLQRLLSDPRSKSAALQQSQDDPAVTPSVSRHHSVDVKDSAAFLEETSTSNRCSLGRKMSYDSAASSSHSASHPNLHHDSLPFPLDADTPGGGLRRLNVSSLQDVERRRSIGMNHYSSDSQLPQCVCWEKTPKKHKLLSGRSSTLSESRESLESGVQLERRGSAALLLDHIAHTRPGYLPPLNPHAPIPHIGVTSGASFPLTASTKTLSGVLIGQKNVVPCAPPTFPRDLNAKKTLWRRHSMQSEQIQQLANFQETFGH